MVFVTQLDMLITPVCAWKESRNGGTTGMQSVINVIYNRMIDEKKTAYEIVMAPFQFSSMTYHRDPQYYLQPQDHDLEYQQAQEMASQASQGILKDITDGATYYYALT